MMTVKGVKGMYARTPEMLDNYSRSHEQIIQTIIDTYGEEIDALLRETDPKYETRVYIKPIYWMDDLVFHPEKYPKLAKLSRKFQKRNISLFLKGQGRVSRHRDNPLKEMRSKTNVWMLPEAVCEPG